MSYMKEVPPVKKYYGYECCLLRVDQVPIVSLAASAHLWKRCSPGDGSYNFAAKGMQTPKSCLAQYVEEYS